MNYLAYFFWNHLPLVLEEKRVIDGKEEVCLILPTSPNQIKKGKQGNWMMMCRLAECEPNERMQTHDIQLSYLTPEDLQKSYDFGYHRRTAHLGRVYEHDRTPSKKLDRTNMGRDIRLDGIIVLSNIPKDLIFRNAQNNKRYISNLTFRGLHDDGYIYTGSLCVDDIPRPDIQTNPENGKKFINVRLRKMEKLDTYFNTHELVIARPDGECVTIGLFKEWRKDGYVPPQTPQYPTPPNEPLKNTPNEINGIKF
ncbi:MAG: hypothetical protein K2N48_01155 [Muribaculaceae bacterium]|nr:hypothetical protein [Muribaculaceae bacterium]